MDWLKFNTTPIKFETPCYPTEEEKKKFMDYDKELKELIPKKMKRNIPEITPEEYFQISNLCVDIKHPDGVHQHGIARYSKQAIK